MGDTATSSWGSRELSGHIQQEEARKLRAAVEEQKYELTPTKLVDDYREYKMQRVHGRSMATANWVTTLAHDCEAYAVYMRTVPPDQRRPMKDSLGMIFAEGDDQARAIKRDLLDMGYEVEGAEGQMAWPKYQITGRQDIKIRRQGARHSVFTEVKSCSPFTYDSINSVEDLKNHKWSFIQKWYKQVTLYMVLKSVQKYWMLLKNKASGQIKIVEFILGDDELRVAETMLKKAEKTNYLVQIGQMPSTDMKISAPDLCGECEFFPVCLPDLNFGLAAQVLTEETAAELTQKADRLAELKPLAKEYGDLDDEVKSEIKALCADGGESVVFGDWIASVKRTEIKTEKEPRKGFTKVAVKLVKTEAA